MDIFKDEKFVEILFVDTGEFHHMKFNSLFTIHPDLIIQLPFQVFFNIYIK